MTIDGDSTMALAPQTADPKRLARVITLDAGSHNPNGKWCAMEAVAYVAAEPWSDHPECACPVIGAFMRNWNDNLPQADRDRLLLPLVPRLVGTKGSKVLESRRATMAADWLVRVHTPAWLRLAGLNDQAKALEDFPEILNFAKTPSIKPILEAARNDAYAARDAARDAARAAARDAARAAAGAAARAAARDAAGAAAWAALVPTKLALQASAVALIERMSEAK